jgi:Beta-galactosidase/Glycosyl hydrolase catalytic core
VIRRSRLPLTLLICALAIPLLAPATGQAAKRKVPYGTFGAIDFLPPNNLSQTTRDGMFALMARSGVESVRALFYWPSIEANQGRYNWTPFDREVGQAASHGLTVLATVQGSPRWASAGPSGGDYAQYPPKNLSDYQAILTTLIGRYGPKGTFWAANPTIPKRPIREWQIWNEPSATYFLHVSNYRTYYPKLLKAGYRAVKKADPRSKVVAAGLASFLQETGKKTYSWTDLAAFYKRGHIRKYFDIAAIHPFNPTPKATVDTVKEFRKVMNKYKDRRKPIYVTEFTFLGSKGKLNSKDDYFGLEVTAKQQRKYLAATYKSLIKNKGLRVKKAFWYALGSAYSPVSCDNGSTDPTFQYAGLLSVTCRGTVFTATPLLSAYAATAKKYEGCAKGDDARRCR